jgi:hypothetical protein
MTLTRLQHVCRHPDHYLLSATLQLPVTKLTLPETLPRRPRLKS